HRSWVRSPPLAPLFIKIFMQYNIPHHILFVLHSLEEAGFEAFIVGGSVRDLILGHKTPVDWDITTNALPPQIQELFPDSVYENTFGTVGVKYRNPNETVEIIEITTYRKESQYTDSRHPEQVEFVSELSQDLARRDFTVNALAMNRQGEIKDFFGGLKDLKAKIIRTVGEPQDRFNEDALRLMRAVRFAIQLDFKIESNTLNAIQNLAPKLKHIAKERIRDELTKMMQTPRAMQGYILLKDSNLLQYSIPELLEGVNVEQNGHHIYDVWEHLLRTMQHACDRSWSFDLRMAGLLHDIAKPRTKEGIGKTSTFHNHEIVGASMAYEILNRLHYPKKFVARISKLVRYHMFYYDTNEVTEASIRKLIRNVGFENIKDLIKLRECDRIGSGTPKARPYRLRHFEYMTEKVMLDPIDLSMLAIDGNVLIKELHIPAGPMIGMILNVLLAEILETPDNNTVEYLKKQAKNLATQDLKDLKIKAINLIEEKQREQDEEIRRKFFL
ncbi:MAG: HD domain-containing protein, partial [Candidatus Paceibacterota bacterium]